MLLRCILLVALFGPSFVCGDASNASSPSKEELFLAWFRKNGGRANNITLDDFPPMGRGVKPLVDVKMGQEVIFVPPRLAISLDLLQKSKDPNIKYLAKEIPSEEELLAAFLLYERSKGESSFWYPYLQVLPDNVPNLVHFSDYEMMELQHSTIIYEALNHRKRVHEHFKHFVNRTSHFIPFPSLEAAQAAYLWATSIVDSRGFRFRGHVVLAPLADMMNYAPHPESRESRGGNFFLLHHMMKPDGLRISADRDCKAGEQLFEDYGDNMDDIYLQHHGFVPEENPFRCVYLTVPNIDDDLVTPHAANLLKAMQFARAPRKCMDSTGHLGQSMEVYITSFVFNAEEVSDCLDIIASSGKSWAIVMDMCGYQRVSKVLASVRRGDKVQLADGSLELRTLTFLRSLIELHSNMYSTTRADDRSIMNLLRANSSTESEHKYLSVKYRHHMKMHWAKMCDLFGSEDCFLRDATMSIEEAPHRELEELVADFNSWFQGARALTDPPATSKVAAAVIPGYRVGTVASEDIGKEDVYLAVPEKVVMDATKAARDFVVGEMVSALERRYHYHDNFHELLVFLTFESYVRGNTSKYWPYLRLLPLPHEMDIPLFWTDEQVENRLRPSFVRETVIEYRERVKMMFNNFARVDLIKHIFPPGIITLERYKWATAILDSRSIWWKGGRHLVPMLDLVNCNEGPDYKRVHSTVLEEVNGHELAVTKAGWGFKSGEQVFENYGQPNHIYFTYHGFTLIDGNGNDCVQFSVSISKEERKSINLEAAAPLIQVCLRINSSNSFIAFAIERET